MLNGCPHESCICDQTLTARQILSALGSVIDTHESAIYAISMLISASHEFSNDIIPILLSDIGIPPCLCSPARKLVEILCTNWNFMTLAQNFFLLHHLTQKLLTILTPE